MIPAELIAVLPQLRQMLLAGKSRQVTVHDEHHPLTSVILQTVHLALCVADREQWSRLAFQIRHLAAYPEGRISGRCVILGHHVAMTYLRNCWHQKVLPSGER